jgi:hypothetical protein
LSIMLHRSCKGMIWLINLVSVLDLVSFE